MIYGIEEAVTLLWRSTEPLFYESVMVMTSQLFAMFEQDLKAVNLIGVTCEN